MNHIQKRNNVIKIKQLLRQLCDIVLDDLERLLEKHMDKTVDFKKERTCIIYISFRKTSL